VPVGDLEADGFACTAGRKTILEADGLFGVGHQDADGEKLDVRGTVMRFDPLADK